MFRGRPFSMIAAVASLTIVVLAGYYLMKLIPVAVRPTGCAKILLTVSLLIHLQLETLRDTICAPDHNTP